jgi:hypothetical protein
MSWKFWKKDDLALQDFSMPKQDFSLPNTGLDLSDHFQPGSPSAFPPPGQQAPMPSAYNSSFAAPSYNPAPSFSPIQNATPVHEDHTSNKELEIIAAKLDTIRAQLEILNTRIANLERSEQQAQPKRPWY